MGKAAKKNRNNKKKSGGKQSNSSAAGALAESQPAQGSGYAAFEGPTFDREASDWKEVPGGFWHGV